MNSLPDVQHFASSADVDIYRIPLWVFPEYVGYVHLVLHGEKQTLIDAGSGNDLSNEGLIAGLEKAASQFDSRIDLEALDQVLLTHGHVDHFGGLGFLKERVPGINLGLHPLTRPVVAHYHQRVQLSLLALGRFLIQAGVPSAKREELLGMFVSGKERYGPVQVDFTLKDGEHYEDLFRIVHVPGHAPGLIMIQIGDVLLTSDHILPETSVVLAPESITPYTGVGHYLESLDKALRLVGVRIALGGHEESFENYGEVVRQTKANHVSKVNHIYDLCVEPFTVYGLAQLVYDDMEGYGQLLKLEQVGARVEYLIQRGLLAIDTVSDLAPESLQPLRFRQSSALISRSTLE